MMMTHPPPSQVVEARPRRHLNAILHLLLLHMIVCCGWAHADNGAVIAARSRCNPVTRVRLLIRTTTLTAAQNQIKQQTTTNHADKRGRSRNTIAITALRPPLRSRPSLVTLLTGCERHPCRLSKLWCDANRLHLHHPNAKAIALKALLEARPVA